MNAPQPNGVVISLATGRRLAEDDIAGHPRTGDLDAVCVIADRLSEAVGALEGGAKAAEEGRWAIADSLFLLAERLVAKAREAIPVVD